MENTGLHFKWTVSRGQDTYGYNICSLLVNGSKRASCKGGGYDMEGSALGEWMVQEFSEGLKKLRANSGSMDSGGGFYGLSFWNTKTKKSQKTWTGPHVEISLDGACGFSSMTQILNRLGYALKRTESNTNNSYYTVVKYSRKN